jgi:inner membrane protein
MDPLTHTLVGASLASTRLGRTTRLAAPALMIGANLPDIDVLSYLGGSDTALGFRRGLTHGIPALFVLPALLAAMLWLWSRRWPEARRAGLSGRWLTALCYLAALTHPALDWLNTYGMRWWMPFSDAWAYGDSVFIMDPWLWLVLGACWLLPRRPTRGLGIGLAVAAALLLLLVGARAPAYLPVVALTAAAALAALMVRLPPTGRAARLLPTMGLAIGAGYIAGMLCLHGMTEQRVREAVARDLGRPAEQLMVGPMPADPLRWDVLYLDAAGGYRFGSFDWRGGGLSLGSARLRAADRGWLAAAGGAQIPGFLRWTRFPWIEPETPSPDGRVYVMDARYARRRTTGFGGAALDPPVPEPPVPPAPPPPGRLALPDRLP